MRGGSGQCVINLIVCVKVCVLHACINRCVCVCALYVYYGCVCVSTCRIWGFYNKQIHHESHTQGMNNLPIYTHTSIIFH